MANRSLTGYRQM